MDGLDDGTIIRTDEADDGHYLVVILRDDERERIVSEICARLRAELYGADCRNGEIEVTPAMVEAGVAELKHFSPDLDRGENAVRWIFEAMERASRCKT